MKTKHDILHVLWLPAWYPSKVDFLTGDFIDRHAKAASGFANISVIFVTKDKTLKFGQSRIEKSIDGSLTILRGYYNCHDRLGYPGKLCSVGMHLLLLWKLCRQAKQDRGAFNLAHVHISLRQGLLARWLKRRWGLPYIITEQNSWFMPVGEGRFTSSVILQKIIRDNFKHAARVHVVSSSLGEQLKKKYPFITSYTVIPNVVDTSLFFTTRPSPREHVIFFTITGDTYHKNTDGVLRAFSRFLKAGHSGMLHIAGPNYDQLYTLAVELQISKNVEFHGALSYSDIAAMMQQSDAQIFFTRYETFGCVMAEAMCCGKPVIASQIQVLEENLEHLKNALFVQPENENDLAEKLAMFVIRKNHFDTLAIAEEAAAKYNYTKIGQAFLGLYSAVCDKNS